MLVKAHRDNEWFAMNVSANGGIGVVRSRLPDRSPGALRADAAMFGRAAFDPAIVGE
jgi:hypothetical protein